MKVVTNDLYCGAYILSKGGLLAEIQLNRSFGRQSCLFVLTGSDVLSLHQEFLSGTAIVNLRDFKAAMLHLKDQMFSCKRQDEEERGFSSFEKRKGAAQYERERRRREA